MVCRLCLTESNNSLAIFSEDKIQEYISKYLQLEITPDDPVSKVVCTLCWTQLQSFQIFHLQVEKAQKTLGLVSNCKELKRKTNHNASVGDLFEEVNRETNIKLMKENIVERRTNDDTFNNSETIHYLTVEIFNPEQHNNEIIETSAATASETLSYHMVTYGTEHSRQASSDKEIPLKAKVTKKCQRDKNKQLGDHPEPAKDETSEEGILNVNSKRNRDRPRKNEKKPRLGKVRSEKSSQILQTAKEFDDIIKKHMDLKCELCSVKLIDFAELVRHFRTIHNRPGYALCCNKRLFKRGLVVDHIKMHTNPEYFKCTDCGKVLADRMCLRVHELLTHQNEEDKMFQCPHCPKKFAKQYLIHHHQVKQIPQTERTFTCSDCGRGFPTQITLTKHLNKIHSTIYDKMCEICAKLIRGKAAFERHMEEHKGIVRPHVQCGICGTLLKDKHNVCGKSTPSKSALQSHHKHMHQNVRDFQCTFCDKSFKKAVNLREHLTTHTKEVLYTCPHCPKTFSFNSNMHTHRKKDHREEWEENRRSNVQISTSKEMNSA